MRKSIVIAGIVTLLAGGTILWTQPWLRGSADLQVTKTDSPQPDRSRDEKALLEAIFDYREAFNRGDAEAVAKHFTAEGEFVEDGGQAVHGREAIATELAAFFKQYPEAKLNVQVDWFRWVSPDVVVAEGKATITPKSGAPLSGAYTTVHTKEKGQWKIAFIREALGQGKQGKTREQVLNELDWMIGDWVDSDDTGTLKINVKWSRNKAYLVRSFTVTSKNEVELEGTEIVGWDPANNVLRSWVFDTNGGFASGTWKQKGKSWYCHLAGVQADGKKASAVHIFTPQGADSYTFQSIGRTLDGEVQPDIDEVTVKRAPQGK
jgi:uncharacterized protein (TIGR02246 family)